MKSVIIPVFAITNSKFAITPCKGKEVGAKIVDAMNEGHTVSLSFAGVEKIAASFFTGVFSSLFETFSLDEISTRLLPPADILPLHATVYTQCLQHAKDHSLNPELYNRVIENTFRD